MSSGKPEIMCGISGAFGHVDTAMVQAIERASAAQIHRGPDGHGLWVSEQGRNQAIFAHRRLAIIDLTEGGHQPMVDSDNGNVLCFNGEIYNYRVLRDELIALGHRFTSESDAEVILRAYAAWGETCVERFNGMFAFALWDSAQGRVLLARDRLGIKPLYLAEVEIAGERTTLFASEVRALLATDLVERKISGEAVQTYLWNGFVQGRQTIIEGITSMDAGSLLWLEGGKSNESKNYWHLPTGESKENHEGELRKSLLSSVDQRLISDVPLGVFLSGGIDSSAIAMLASEKSRAQVKTFNVCFEEAEFDESGWARKVADTIGSEHQEVPLTQGIFQSELGEALDSLDQPTFDGINTYFVSKAVREAGITVALSGAGGDELFGGYTSFKDLGKVKKLAKVSGAFGAFVGDAAVNFTQKGKDVPRQTRWGKVADVLATQGELVPLYQVSYSLFTRAFLEKLSLDKPSPSPWGMDAKRLSELSRLTKDQSDLEAISTLELSNFIGQRLLRDTDSASMAVSLEVRVPLLDHQVVEEATHLQSERRYQPLGKKMALRRAALKNFDPAIFDRPKSGFVLPIEKWSRERLRPEITAVFGDKEACRRVGLNHKVLGKLWEAYKAGAPGIYWSRIWSLFVLLRWCEKNRVVH